MNIIINIIFIYIFIYALLYYKYPDIDNNNYIQHKLILFTMVFLYQTILKIIYKIYNKCKVNVKEILYNSLYTATSVVVGYSLYIDINLNDELKPQLDKITFLDKNGKVTLMTVSFVAIIKILILIFNSPYQGAGDCVKYIWIIKYSN